MKKDLQERAEALKQVSSGSAEEYQRKAARMAGRITEELLARPDVEELVGKNNMSMMKDNHANHARFIGSILSSHNPEVLVETVLWVFRAYRSRGFSSNYWAAQMNAWLNIIEEELSPECYAEVYPYYEWMQVNIPVFDTLSDETLQNPDLLK